MPPLTDPEQAACFKNALANWRYEGYILLTDVAYEWMKLNLKGFSVRTLGRNMHEYVSAGGIIDRQKETRPEWDLHDYHYDLRIPIEGRMVYIETRLVYDEPSDPDDPIIQVVNLHDA
jgi:hypothetical protein